MVTTLGAALAAAAVVLVAFWASLMTTLCAAAPLAVGTVWSVVRATTPAPAPPPTSAAPTRPAATPRRQRVGRRVGWLGSAPGWAGAEKAGGRFPGWPGTCWAAYPGAP